MLIIIAFTGLVIIKIERYRFFNSVPMATRLLFLIEVASITR